MSQVEVWIGNVLISKNSPASAAASPAARGRGTLVDAATERLQAVGPCVASLFSAMDIPGAVLNGEVGAEEFELEIGFSLEVGPGGALQLLLSPKAGMTYKAKAKWRRNQNAK